jgi:type II restriction enzyme
VGQTYKWKLLLEIATTRNPIKYKYNISYPLNKMPMVCFATINFYNEINNPQHRGMFKFFDKSFIGKPINADFIANLSTLIDFANERL